MKQLLQIIALFIGLFSFGQEVPSISDAISDCAGATNILEPGTFSLQFTGKGGGIKDLAAYPSLSNVQEKNALWCSFIAPFNGRLTLEADATTGPLQLLVFENETKDICDDIYKGKAEIRRLILGKTTHVGLNLITSETVLYPIDLVAGKHIMICFLNAPKEKCLLDLQLSFEPTDGELKPAGENSKIMDLRADKTTDALSILIRDVETGNPVIANMTLTGIKNMTALYSGSDFFITVEKSGKIQLKIDAEGYFFVDREEPVSAGSDNEIVVWMEPLGEGKSMQIDEIEFVPGSSEFLPTAEPKLKRLKDFLALNAAVKIEIQGHVHATGENTLAGQKLSEARAKRVMIYLIENGIDKNRLTTVGYGNTKPIFPEAKFAYEEQANRRVEIKVL
jgi:outer membrane protein OmpA-like peptidoglycan-associated protein